VKQKSLPVVRKGFFDGEIKDLFAHQQSRSAAPHTECGQQQPAVFANAIFIV
jgi:hypothetical protein